MRFAHVSDLGAEHIDIDIGSSQHDVLELCRKRPLRMAIWRSDSSASQFPIEWARRETSFISGSRARY